MLHAAISQNPTTHSQIPTTHFVSHGILVAWYLSHSILTWYFSP